ncbi:MAG: hypothetical protein HN341_00900, partial [Verrucomicrobia bacterium]|nr:hypothetical protein [Verrucomicrobiota bacterium]
AEPPKPTYEIESPEYERVSEAAGPPRRTRADWHQDPGVQQVLDAFNGMIVDVIE